MAPTPGNYLIRSALNEGLVLQTAGGSKNKGARIEAGYLTEADNRCYWTVADVSGEVKITNLQSGTGNGNLAAGTVASGAAVVQNKYDIGTGAWIAELSGHSMTVNGQSVSTYYLKAHANSSLYLTAPDNGGELFLSEIRNDSTNQEFYFEPSTYLDLKLATPKELRTDGGNTYVIHSGAATFYPQWTSSKSSNVYEMRYRSRRYDMDGNAAEEWSAWTGWSMIEAEAQLNEKKKFTGIMRSLTAVTTPAGVDNQTYSRAEIQVEARLTSAKNAAGYSTAGKITHGTAVSQTINQWCNPSLSITAAVYSPDGLALTYETDYTISGSAITINKITSGGITLIEGYTFTGQDYVGDLYLNCDELYAIPEANSTIRVNATIVEENGIAKRTITQNLTVSYDESWGLSISPTYELTDRLTVRAKIKVYSTLQLYMEAVQMDGTTRWVECDLVDTVTENGELYAIYEFAPPYGAAPNLMWIAVDTNADWTSSITAPSGATVDGEACSWFWIDEQGEPRAAILKYREGEILSPANSITLPANKFVTTGREYPVFRYSKSIERALDIEGFILGSEAETYCTLEDFEAMATANHCVYRDPDGKWYQVAITGISFTRGMNGTNVQISQEAETR